jgi:hypothetical protein
MGIYIAAPVGDSSPGVAPGGLQGQYLRKASDVDYDTDWEDLEAAGHPGGGNPTDLSYNAGTRLLSSSTGADVTLPLATSTTAGLAPQSGGGTTNYLRSDLTWAPPPVGAGGITDGDKGDITVSGSGSTWTIGAGAVNTARLGGDITAAGKALLDDASASAQRVTLGLGNVDNTSDANKPISGATQTALDGKVGTGDARLSDAREWTAPTFSQAEIEDPTSTVRRAPTGERIRQAIVAWWSGYASALGQALATAADAAAARTALGLGSLATQSGTFSGTSSGTNTGDDAVNSLYSGLVSNANHTGDATGSTVLTLATVNANVGSFGSATAAPIFTVNAKGLVTAADTATITPAIGSVTGLGTGIATALAVNAGSAGAPVLFNAAGGTPSSISLINATGLPLATGVTGVLSVANGGTGTATPGLVQGANITISGTWPNQTISATGGGAGSPGGSTGQLQVNNAGSFGGLSTTSVDGSGNITLSGRWTSSLNGAASAPPISLTGTWFTGGTSTTTKPQFLIEPTGTTSTGWSTAGTGFGVNAPSGFTGVLAEIQLNGARRLALLANGNLVVEGDISRVNGGYSITEAGLNFNNNFLITANNGNVKLKTGAVLEWSSTTNTNGATDLAIRRDGANALAQRNGINAQTLRVYDTFASDTDYHRLTIRTVRATLSNVSGASVTATALIPAGAVVMGVTSKITTALGTGNGTTGYQVGTAADPDRWGNITGTALGTSSDNRNWTSGTIECFPSATNVVVTANGGNFNGTGVIYLSVQYMAGEAD